MNPFMLAMAALNLAAAWWYFSNGNPKLGAITICYAASSVILATV
jgi:hypothetical protein